MSEDRQEKHGAGGKRPVWIIGMIICLAGAAVAIFCLVRAGAASRREEEFLDQLADQTVSSQTEPEGESQETVPTPEPEKSWEELSLEEKNRKLEETFGIDIPDKEPDFASLQAEVNPDIYAWVYIPDSTIDYPILQHPEDNSYYLNYNIDGSKGRPGCIYTENYNTKDFTDHNTVVYGHNMRNGTMFAGLHSYEDSEFFQSHPYIYIYTPEEVFVYRVFGAYEFSNIHLLAGYDTTTEEGFGAYLKDVKEVRSMNCNFDRVEEVTEQDRILTLSTCAKNKPDSRYLVQGVQLRVEEGTILQDDGETEPGFPDDEEGEPGSLNDGGETPNSTDAAEDQNEN